MTSSTARLRRPAKKSTAAKASPERLYARLGRLTDNAARRKLLARHPELVQAETVTRLSETVPQKVRVDVEEAMALLPEEQRTAIILKEYHGMTFQEIADMQGCPLSTVKTRLYQGLTVLRRHLEKNGQMTPQLVKRK